MEDVYEIVMPSYDGRGISNIPPTIARVFGSPYLNDKLPLSEDVVSPDLLDVRNVVLLMIDTLGYRRVVEAVRLRGALYRLFEKSGLGYLTSTFPATTATAVTTISTGRTPLEHGVVGYKLYLREYGMVVNMIRLSPAFMKQPNVLLDFGFNPEEATGHDTIYKALSDVGAETYVLLGEYYANSGLSHIANRGAEVRPYLTLADMLVNLRKILEAGGERKYIYAYWEGLDSVSHKRTPLSEENLAEMEMIATAIKTLLLDRLDEKVAKETLLMITGDHGQSYVVRDNMVVANEDRELMDLLLIPPTGESRVSYLYPRECRAEEVEEYFNRKHPGKFLLLRSRDAVRMGLFGYGNPHPELTYRIGELIALPKPGYGLVYRYEKKEYEEERRGAHGGLTTDEQLVAFAVGRMSDF